MLISSPSYDFTRHTLFHFIFNKYLSAHARIYDEKMMIIWYANEDDDDERLNEENRFYLCSFNSFHLFYDFFFLWLVGFGREVVCSL